MTDLLDFPLPWCNGNCNDEKFHFQRKLLLDLPTGVTIVMPRVDWFSHIHNMFSFWDIRTRKEKKIIL